MMLNLGVDTSDATGTSRAVSKDITVGKDILELLSSSMYVDPLTIYREYVQNAADAIDEAVKLGLLKDISEGRIDISIDHIGRRVLIRDNGAGIEGAQFEARVTSFGASKKRGTDARGFRGVGRLAGLGYCQELIFRSRRDSGAQVTELHWDCRTLKRCLAEKKSEGNLADVVHSIASLRLLESNDYPEHFFEVEIVKPRRIGKDVLLNEKLIEDFISQVGPVPFSPKFSFADEIMSLLADGSDIKRYQIHINNDDPICRPYRDEIRYSENKTGMGRSIEPIRIDNLDGGLAAIGWILHHDYQGALPTSGLVGGLRAFCGNIQIGDKRIFAETFPEERFNSWAIGEVHILDQKVIPNGRRDQFEINTHLQNILTHLTPHTQSVARHCRVSSQARNWEKRFESLEVKAVEKLDILAQGAISRRLGREMQKELGTIVGELNLAVRPTLFDDSAISDLQGRIRSIEKRIESITEATIADDPLDKLPKGKRAAYREMIDLIYECSSNRVAAKALVERIMSRISGIAG